MMSQAKRWCFTLNNYTEEEEANLLTLPDRVDVQYFVFGREVGEQGTPHLQGYVYFTVAKRFTFVQSAIPRAHIEVSRGSPKEASDYCKKDGDFFEHGTVPGKQGSRSDIDEILQWLDEFIEENGRAPTAREVVRDQPKAFLRYRDFVHFAQLRAPEPGLIEGDTRPWQADLESILSEPCDDTRSVLFYVDERGGSGKTWFQQYLFTKMPDRVQMLQPATFKDMSYLIDVSKDIFLINVPRGRMESFSLNFSILECLKDRVIQSTKYTPVMKVLRRVPHVVVFSNEDPPRDILSTDRYKVTNLYNP